MAVLDTSFLIDVLKGNKQCLELMNLLDRNNEEKCTTTVNAMELYFGALKLNKSTDAIFSLLDSLIILEFDFNSAIEAAKIKIGLVKGGTIIDAEDMMIAGVAIFNKQKVVTRNAKHFSLIKDLEVETY